MNKFIQKFPKELVKDTYYLCSYDGHFGDDRIKPRIPKNAEEFGRDSQRKRITFCETIAGYLRYLGNVKAGDDLYVFTPYHQFVSYSYEPTEKQAPDREKTGEIWYRQQIYIRKIMKIHVISVSGDMIRYIVTEDYRRENTNAA